MSLLRLGLTLQGTARFAAFDAACRDPRSAQQAVLARLLAREAATAFGREHGFSRLAGPADFAAAVPVRDYEGFRPWVERQVAGELAVLTRESPEMFTTTSGTTGEPKLIPVTPGWRRQMTSMLRLWMVGALRDHPRCFDGRVLTVVSPAVESHTAKGVPCGAMTGLTHMRAPWLIRRHYVAPYEAALIRDYEARYYTLLRLALAGPLSAIVTPNPSTLVKLAEVASRHGETLLRAIADGELGRQFPDTLDQAGYPQAIVRERLLGRLRKDPERARALARQAERDGGLLPRHAWPDLQLIGCWLGGSAGLQARHLAPLFGEGPALRDVGLIASEGRMTVPLADDTAAGPLAVHANYYEFIPEDAMEQPNPPVLGAHELADGGRYYLVLTGGNGLYRYDLNDVVEVRGFYGRTPCVAFLRKGRDMASLTGEKLHLNHVQAALAEAEAATGLGYWQVRWIPDAERMGYDLLLEPRERAGDAAWAAFAEQVDTALARINPEYASKRESGRLAPPALYLMARGWSERAAAAALAEGKRDTQFKWQVMAPIWDATSREAVDRVVALSPETPA